MFAYAQYAHLQERGITAPLLTRRLTATPQNCGISDTDQPLLSPENTASIITKT